MALRSNGPILLSLPAFRGTTRLLVLIAAAAFLLVKLSDALSPAPPLGTMGLVLTPALAFGHWMPWQVVTYGLLAPEFLSTAFALLSVWFLGSSLEDERGGRWLLEYYLASTVGGALLASLLSMAHIPGVRPYSSVFGLWPASLALLLAFARRNPDAEMRLYFVLRVKAKHLVAIFLLFYLGSALLSHDPFSAITALSVALSGYVYLRMAPRRGMSFTASEGWFGARNAYYRARRRRAAKKFTVYMRKQGKEVNIDASGRYVDPDGKPREPRNFDDKRWMN